jgi:hypothetical protein
MIRSLLVGLNARCAFTREVPSNRHESCLYSNDGYMEDVLKKDEHETADEANVKSIDDNSLSCVLHTTQRQSEPR